MPPPPPVFLLRFHVRQLSVTIDAAFVQHMHTQSLELRVWRGDRAGWPTGGTACGVAKVVLRSLLTTLGGVGGDVAITQAAGGGGGGGGGDDRVGSVAARLFFKHRGLGSSGGADAERETGHPAGGGAGAGEGKEAAVAAQQGEASGGGGRRRAPVTFREEVEVLGEEQGGPSNRTGRDPAARGDGAESTTTTKVKTTRKTAGRAPLAESAGSSKNKPGEGTQEEEEEGPQGSNSRQRQREGSERAPPPPSGTESELRVFVERAMRLVVASAAAATAAAAPLSGEPEVAGGVAVSPGSCSPSTYVTFRWEEEGKPPLRSPLLVPSASAVEAAADVAEGSEKIRKVKQLYKHV